MKDDNAQEVTILLFEDDPGHAELVKMNLERSGISNQIIHFQDGNAGVEFLFAEKADKDRKFLVILDLNMPGMDGLQVLNRIKNDDSTHKIPVIILTTTIRDDEVEKCYEEGCNLYINKPMEYEDFSSAINKLGLFLKTARIPGQKKVLAK